MRGGAGACSLLVCLALGVARAQDLAPSPPTLGARLSDAAEAMEYWDVAAQLDSGHRLFARFLITNEGPGAHTAAAVGHLVLPDGTVTPIKYGRTRDGWQLSPDRRRLKIASAVLDLSQPLWQVEIDSDTYGFKVRLQLSRAAVPVSTEPLPGAYWVDVVTPTPARGTVWLRGMAAPLTVEGTVALTHTRMERNEADLVQRRAELFARAGDLGVYLADLTLADGRQRGTLIVCDNTGVRYRSDDLPVSLAAPLTAPGDPAYPVPARWQFGRPEAGGTVRLEREWLRWAPLDIVPQPFRFLLSLRAEPQLVWADAELDLDLAADGASGAAKVRGGHGTALVALARALIRTPALLILDEATTALDRDTEIGICDTFHRLRGSVTIFAICHHGHLVEIADRVYNVDGGVIVPVALRSAHGSAATGA